jgi:aspartyl aminopeptidase
MDVVDIGAPVLSIHNSYEISSKIDLWWLRKANHAFFTAAD